MVERFPIAGGFTISRGSRAEAVVVVARVSAGEVAGRGECVPYARYGESVESVVAAIESVRARIEAGADRMALQRLLPAGAARNALDCALWDLEARQSGVPVHVLAGLDRLRPVTTAFTISLGTAQTMARQAGEAFDSGRPVLKIKLGAPEGDMERIRAVRAAAPGAVLLADANEGWREQELPALLEACAAADVALVEQPLPAGADAALERMERPAPVCADESMHTRADLASLRARYDAVNLKLDKTGGLTEALATAEEATRLGFALMVGCMVGTSLAMAPAMLLAPRARFVDLDGPLLLARDRSPGLRYDGAVAWPPGRELWG
ncbi:N-acetyl-D-Glu racemase DgcA [Camelimonas abortus]|uniref:Dipeptide epimerase n=1 Tax=Camelimonas abortus TaxID=1017184 RepID=A0ABV7LGD2_9HYPH